MKHAKLLGVALWLIGLLVLLFWLAPYARAQEKPVTTFPLGVSSSNLSGSIAITNTFQSVVPALTTLRGRVNCTIINYGSNTMWVFEDSLGAGLTAANVSTTATKAKSVQLTANQAYYCAQGGTVIKSALFITGTSADVFYAGQQ